MTDSIYEYAEGSEPEEEKAETDEEVQEGLEKAEEEEKSGPGSIIDAGVGTSEGYQRSSTVQ